MTAVIERQMKEIQAIPSALVMTSMASMGAIVATEVGNNAPGTDSDNEYVVILNTGASSIDLTDYDIADAGLSWDAIGSITIGAGQSLVISTGANQATLESEWGQSIPGGTLFTIVSGLAAFNNTGTEEIYLRDETDTTIYSFTFTTTLGDDSPPTAVGLGPNGGTGGASVTPFSTIPEPTIALLGGLGLFGLLRRRR
ncbi:lamin tail domain-containing protein [Haloferula sp. A504]|uniref:lamin tail domain-containing protein n=1 Tax=Haloferula sp. A504 TaxID=3373601 RepID=UPI0031C0D186|nr:lamin tail domain-containing protein [Verrucomicrobiaceae bacterium E54]